VKNFYQKSDLSNRSPKQPRHFVPGIPKTSPAIAIINVGFFSSGFYKVVTSKLRIRIKG
jgi:hypothetical protein